MFGTTDAQEQMLDVIEDHVKAELLVTYTGPKGPVLLCWHEDDPYFGSIDPTGRFSPITHN